MRVILLSLVTREACRMTNSGVKLGEITFGKDTGENWVASSG